MTIVITEADLNFEFVLKIGRNNFLNFYDFYFTLIQHSH